MRYLVITKNYNWYFKSLKRAKEKQAILLKLGINSKLYKSIICTGILIEL